MDPSNSRCGVSSGRPYVRPDRSCDRSTPRCQFCDAQAARYCASPVLEEINDPRNKIHRVSREIHHMNITIALLDKVLPPQQRHDFEGHSKLINKKTTVDCKRTERELAIASAKWYLNEAWAGYWGDFMRGDWMLEATQEQLDEIDGIAEEMYLSRNQIMRRAEQEDRDFDILEQIDVGRLSPRRAERRRLSAQLVEDFAAGWARHADRGALQRHTTQATSQPVDIPGRSRQRPDSQVALNYQYNQAADPEYRFNTYMDADRRRENAATREQMWRDQPTGLNAARDLEHWSNIGRAQDDKVESQRRGYDWNEYKTW
ncbi:hypothetical protein ACHAQA_009503 [Verticillium albo-atrum]